MTLFDTTMMHTFIQIHRMYTSRANTSVNRGLWVILLCPYRLMDCERCTPQVAGVDDGEAGHSPDVDNEWGGEVEAISVPSSILL